MRLLSITFDSLSFVSAFLTLTLATGATAGHHASAAPVDSRHQHGTKQPLHFDLGDGSNIRNVGVSLFMELEELARLVDISYCVGVTGIRKPFECLSRCSEFPGFDLVDAWNTGPLLSDSCGYIALDHNAAPHGRIVVAFRGTYSIANTIVDLTTVPQEYVPYPSDPHNDDGSDTPHHGKKRGAKWWDWIHGIVAYPRSCVEAMDRWSSGLSDEHREHCRYLMNENKDRHAAEAVARRELRWQAYADKAPPKCENCTVHMGFLSSWQNTREVVLSQIILAKKKYPQYTVHLVGHSLGGAVAALAGLELEVKGYDPVVTTFGEPRIGNSHLRDYLDMVFDLDTPLEAQRYRRITHVDDPVPLLPLTKWGYKMHAGEVYIGKKHLSPSLEDLRLCEGDEDMSCIAGAETDLKSAGSKYTLYDEYNVLQPNFSEACYDEGTTSGKRSVMLEDEDRLVAEYYGFRTKWGLPARMKMWQLFFAHRDYFWRLGLCVPGGDPRGWLGRTPTYVAGYDGEGERVGDEM